MVALVVISEVVLPPLSVDVCRVEVVPEVVVLVVEVVVVVEETVVELEVVVEVVVEVELGLVDELVVLVEVVRISPKSTTIDESSSLFAER